MHKGAAAAAVSDPLGVAFLVSIILVQSALEQPALLTMALAVLYAPINVDHLFFFGAVAAAAELAYRRGVKYPVGGGAQRSKATGR